jgi:putative membrane protein insertion efficiency factor
MQSAAKFVVLQMLRGYKWAISPLFPPACRYVPTCSEYAMEAVERYGALRGGFIAVMRLLRCHPFAHGGYDPVVKRGGVEPRTILAGLRGADAPVFSMTIQTMTMQAPVHACCPSQDLERNA